MTGRAQPEPTAGLSPDKALTQYIHTVWNDDDGLPHSTVNAVAQTPDGYLWVGTEGGVVRFNGADFDVFDRSNTEAFAAGHAVRTLLVDQQGQLWIGTAGAGLIRYVDGAFAPVTTPSALDRAQVSVLHEDEKEVGVALIDIGGGTTDIAVFEDNTIRHTAVIAVAGDKVTDDIRKGLGVMRDQAEQLKRQFGTALLDLSDPDEQIEIPGIGGRSEKMIGRDTLAQVIQPRLEEILEIAAMEIKRSGYGRHLGVGCVLTGGGSLIPGTDELAADVLGMEARIGRPMGLSGGLVEEVDNPKYATGVGLVLDLGERRPENLGRVVMLAPPNRGSELVDLLGGSELFEWIYGPTATQLGTDPESLPNRLPPPDYALGVIAGSGSVNPAGSLLIEGESDGTVAVEHTKVEGMRDFLVVPHSHTFIMRGEDVAEQVIAFLRTGRFRHETRPED